LKIDFASQTFTNALNLSTHQPINSSTSIWNFLRYAQKRLWSWRESNPRPNEEAICFLHAYLRLGFRAAARPKPPTVALSAECFACRARPRLTIPDFPTPLWPNRFREWHSRDVPFQHLCQN